MEPSPRWIAVLRDLVLSSLREYGLPLPLDKGVCSEWRRGLPSGPSRRVLYTSCMYQLAPAISRAVGAIERAGAAGGGLRAALASIGAKIFGRLVVRPDERELERAGAILRSIYSLLRRGGVEFGLLDDEPYSGALLYELGFVDDFARHAREVYAHFKRAGVREVITVDPHTHYVLERVYPQFIPEFDIKVVSYIDLIDPAAVKVRARHFVIHDSCLYARFLDRHARVRELLASGEPVEDPLVTGRESSGCCGGPIESVAPALSAKIARERVERLSRLSRTVVVMCPICLASLGRAGSGLVEVRDLSELLEL
jgi:Fe-S oxidoreductase